MLKVGITGGIGAGKSSVCGFISDMGYEVIDADKVAREVLDIYPEILMFIEERFGKEFICNGRLNRRNFAKEIFQDKEKLKVYTDFIMPFILKEIESRFRSLEEKGERLGFLDAPLLFEERDRLKVDVSVFVDATERSRIERVKVRDKSDEDSIKDRMKNQMERDDRIKLADYVITNKGTLPELKEKTERLLGKLIRRSDEENNKKKKEKI